MDLTVQDLIVDSMSLIGAVAIDETPTDSELSLGLRTANMMLNRWSSLPNMLRAHDTIAFNTSVNTAEYTIGEWGATISSCKPIKLFSATIKNTSGINLALDVVEKATITAQPDKTTSVARPSLIAYDAVTTGQSTPYGQLILYPTPDQTYTVQLEISRTISQFDNLTDVIELEPLYYEALKYGIATRLFRHYHAMTVQIPPDIVMREQETVKTLYTLNSKTPLAATDLGTSAGSYNVYTDER